MLAVVFLVCLGSSAEFHEHRRVLEKQTLFRGTGTALELGKPKVIFVRERHIAETAENFAKLGAPLVICSLLRSVGGLERLQAVDARQYDNFVELLVHCQAAIR